MTTSFTFNLTPMFLETSLAQRQLAKAVDRNISLSYRSLLFLKSHGFRFERAFNDGVCYLSRQEESGARGFLLQNNIGQGSARPNETEFLDKEARGFYHASKKKIAHWLQRSEEVAHGIPSLAP